MAPNLKPLRNQVIVITGASSGIGLVTARMAAARGARVVAVARNEDALRSLVHDIRKQGGTAIHAVCDVGNSEQVRRARDLAVDTFGQIDTWVNNAGISIFGEVWNVPLESWRRMFDTTYWGVVHGSRAAIEHFRARGGPGAIVITGSFFGERAPPVQSTYSSAKFAVHGLAEAMRQEIMHNRLPISVSVVKPGRIDTPYNEHAGQYMPMQAVHRGMIYPPEAVAEAILWCAEHPKRDMYVGSQSKAATVIGRVAPHLADWIMSSLMYRTHQSQMRRVHGSRERALFKPGYGGQARGTHEPLLLRNRSYYVKMTERPWLAAAFIAAAGLVASRELSRRAPLRR